MRIPEDLYTSICEVMPIPCVDIIVTDEQNRILLIKRNNEPAKGEWWFPGGRVCFGETREEAAIRKLKEECGLKAVNIKEMGTHDLILPFPMSSEGNVSHAITTIFHAYVVEIKNLRLDDQSKSAKWRPTVEWLSDNLHDFIRNQIKNYEDNNI